MPGCDLEFPAINLIAISVDQSHAGNRDFPGRCCRIDAHGNDRILSGPRNTVVVRFAVMLNFETDAAVAKECRGNSFLLPEDLPGASGIRRQCYLQLPVFSESVRPGVGNSNTDRHRCW